MANKRYTLELPPSSNRYWRTTRNGLMFLSAEAKAYKRTVQLLAGRSDPFTGEVGITLKVFRARKSGDLDNKIKVILDALQGVGYLNDSQIVEIHAFRFDDKNNPCVEIEIREI